MDKKDPEISKAAFDLIAGILKGDSAEETERKEKELNKLIKEKEDSND